MVRGDAVVCLGNIRFYIKMRTATNLVDRLIKYLRFFYLGYYTSRAGILMLGTSAGSEDKH